MRDDRRRKLMRLVHGELPAEESDRLRRRMREDAALAEACSRLQEVWDGLTLPGVPSEHLDLAPSLLRRIEAQDVRRDLSWSTQPLWARTAAACALVVGMILGAFVVADLRAESDLGYFPNEPTLAETYWLTFDAASVAELQPEGEP